MSNYTYTNARGIQYYLNEKEVQLRNGKPHMLHYFSKDERDTACELPAGKTVVENARTGLPMLKKVV